MTFPSLAAALGAKSQVPRDYGMRTAPPRREGPARRLPRQPLLETAAGAAGAPARRPPGEHGVRQPAAWVLGEPPGHLRWVRAPNRHLGVPGARNCELFDAVRLRLPAAAGKGRTGHARPLEGVSPAVRPPLQRLVRGAPQRRRCREDGPQREQVHVAQPHLRPAGRPGAEEPGGTAAALPAGGAGPAEEGAGAEPEDCGDALGGAEQPGDCAGDRTQPAPGGKDRAGRPGESWGIA